MTSKRRKVRLLFGGKIAHFIPFWRKITRDKFVLQCVKGIEIDFNGLNVHQNTRPQQINMSSHECKFIENKLMKLCCDKVIQKVDNPPSDAWFSNIFLRLKKNNSYRMILNLKPLNKLIKYEKFKMDGINEVLKMIRPFYQMISIDLTQAYFHARISSKFQKYLFF